MKQKSCYSKPKPKETTKYLNRKCERLDKEIDQLVYKLYGLTGKEIKTFGVSG